MRHVYRGLRRLMAVAFVVTMLSGAAYFAYTAVTGIADELEFRREQNRRDDLRSQTGTAIAPLINEESEQLQNPASPTDNDQPVEQNPEPTLDPDISALLEDGNGPIRVAQDFTTNTVVPTGSFTPSQTPTPMVVAQDDATAFPTNTPPPTAIPSNTPFPTVTLTPTNTFTPTNTATPTATFTPSNTPTFTPTFTPSVTPTFTNTPLPTLPIEGTYATPLRRPVLAIPERAALVENDPDIVNVVLLGSDIASSLARTDVIIVVSVNKQAGTVAMWHIPRDLMVYIPGHTMDKINLTFQIGQQTWPGGGPALMREMFLYNFGLEIDYYARVDFDDFQAIIRELGNVTVSVDCQITDWRLIDPDNAPPEAFTEEGWEPYWEQYTLPVGQQELTPYMALWYARSRVTTSDLDRGRRQMDLLRAMYRTARADGIFNDLSLFPTAVQIIETDMPVEAAASLAPVALALDLGNIERFSLVEGVHMTSWTTPDDGRFVFRPEWDALRTLVEDFVTPPARNRLLLSSASIEVQDGTLYGLGWGHVAVDRLAWEGFSPVLTEVLPTAVGVTQIYDFTGQTKGSELDRLQTILRVTDENVIIQPDPDREYDYRVVIGRSYQSCIYGSSSDEVQLSDAPTDVTSE